MEKITGEQYDAVVILQPTSPFREVSYIDDVVEKLFASDADSAVSVFAINTDYHPIKIKKIVDGYLEDYCVQEVQGTRRQDIPVAYKRSSHVYAMKRRCTIDKDSLYGDSIVATVVPDDWIIDIDEPKDWEKAEEMAKKWLAR